MTLSRNPERRVPVYRCEPAEAAGGRGCRDASVPPRAGDELPKFCCRPDLQFGFVRVTESSRASNRRSSPVASDSARHPFTLDRPMPTLTHREEETTMSQYAFRAGRRKRLAAFSRGPFAEPLPVQGPKFPHASAGGIRIGAGG